MHRSNALALVLVGLALLAAGALPALAAWECEAVPDLTELSDAGLDLTAITRRAEEIVARCPSVAPAHELAGDALRLAGDLDAAAEALRRAVALAPEDPVPVAKLALVARESGNRREFELMADAALALALDPAAAAAVETLLEAPAEPAPEYRFKDAEDLAEGLLVGSKSIRPKAVGTDYRGDYFVGAKGLGANLDIVFRVGTAELLPEGERQVEALGQALQRAAPGEQYLIEGHASSEGDVALNQRLSEDRARVIADLLVRQFGVSAAAIETVGRGVRFPVIENGVENLVKSRRVTVLRLFDE